MKKIIFIHLILFSIYQDLRSQTVEGLIKYEEVYGLRLEFNKKLTTAKHCCGVGFLNSSKNTLYEISIKHLLFTRDSTVFNTQVLEGIKYIVLPSELEVALNYEYDVLAGNSSSLKYIVGYRVFEGGIVQHMQNKDKNTIFYGLEKCTKLSTWQKIKIKLGFKLNIEGKALRNENTENAFVKYILSISDHQ